MTFTRLRDWGVIPLRPRLGGFTAKRRGLNKEAAGRSAPGVSCIALWLARNPARRNASSQRGRHTSLYSFEEILTLQLTISVARQ